MKVDSPFFFGLSKTIEKKVMIAYTSLSFLFSYVDTFTFYTDCFYTAIAAIHFSFRRIIFISSDLYIIGLFVFKPVNVFVKALVYILFTLDLKRLSVVYVI